MEATHVIKKPLLTEKSTFAMNEHKKYSFEVDRRANKAEIKAAIEQIYKVRVTDVKTQNRKGGGRKLKYGWVADPQRKTAMVSLHAEDVIELF
jgi:large subunit ribosomal protein L23